MGLTIFYSGKIRDIALLPEMTEEVQDICDNLRWICQPMRPYPEIPLQGFQFHPPGSEPVWMTFQKDGLLADPVYHVLRYTPFSRTLPHDEFSLSTVTQFAGMDAHMAMIKLLRYLSRRYFEYFKLIDESEYWETGDEALCNFHFVEFTRQMNEIAEKLSKLDGQQGLSGDSVLMRLDELLHTRRIQDILKALE